MSTFWKERSTAAKIGFVLAGLAIVAVGVLAATWVFRDHYQPLFTELDPRDAAAIAAELDRQKVPYRIANDGAALLVPEESVHATRLKVMGKGIDLKGTVGFEIFNSTDFGMTEFAQKINYQRALQGELARSIMALDEVKTARVHLVLPESGLLRRAAVRPKASVTLGMRNDRRLRPEQIQGIQRLVAAAVPEMDAASVTVLDQQGVALSRRAEPEGEGDAGRLEAKRDVETYLARKVMAVLEKAFGPGRAIVTVDVALNHDQMKVTREEVLNGGAGIVRRRDTTQPGAALLPAAIDGAREAKVPAASTSEVEYQLGRKVEQVVAAPGGVRRISVGVLLSSPLPAEQAQSLRQVIAMAVGLDPARGDDIAFSWVDGAVKEVPQARLPERVVTARPAPVQPQLEWWPLAAVAALLAMLPIGMLAARRRREPRLSEKEREEILARLKAWLAEAPR